MRLFLATEVLFFGALLLAWIYSRHWNATGFDAGAARLAFLALKFGVAWRDDFARHLFPTDPGFSVQSRPDHPLPLDLPHREKRVSCGEPQTSHSNAACRQTTLGYTALCDSEQTDSRHWP